MTAARERIIETAFRLFLTRGYAGTSMAELVTETGLSKGALYHHFSSKESLRDAVIEHFWLRYMTGAAPGDRSLPELLHALAGSYADLLESVTAVAGDPVAYYRFVLEVLPGTRAPLLATLGQTRQAVAAAAGDAQQAGTVSTALPPDRVAETAIALIEGTGLLCGLDPQSEPRRVLRAAVDDLLVTLAPEAR